MSRPSFLVESQAESVFFSSIWRVESRGASGVQPTNINTKRTAVIVPTNNGNRPCINTLREWTNFLVLKLPPPDLAHRKLVVLHIVCFKFETLVYGFQ